MKVLVIEPEKAPYAKDIEGTLESLQQEISGYVQAVYPFEDPVALLCDDDGKLKNKTPNRALRDDQGNPYDILVGTVLIVGLGEENFTDLSDELIEKYTEVFRSPEVFLAIDGVIHVIKITEEMEK